MKLKNIDGIIDIVTGLHIGGGDDTMKIGGVDSTVVKREIFCDRNGNVTFENEDNKVREPYIPGSSLKGKVRSLLEHHFGLIKFSDRGNVITSNNKEGLDSILDKNKIDLIVKLFGEGGDRQNSEGIQITRTTFRDTFITPKTRKQFLDDKKELFETKAENSINRKKGTAVSPRFIERVPPGVKFNFEIIIKEFEEDKEWPLKESIILGLKLLEKDFLGGSGSRGYGRIKFGIEKDFSDKSIKDLNKKIEEKLKKIKIKT